MLKIYIDTNGTYTIKDIIYDDCPLSHRYYSIIFDDRIVIGGTTSKSSDVLKPIVGYKNIKIPSDFRPMEVLKGYSTHFCRYIPWEPEGMKPKYSIILPEVIQDKRMRDLVIKLREKVITLSTPDIITSFNYGIRMGYNNNYDKVSNYRNGLHFALRNPNTNEVTEYSGNKGLIKALKDIESI